MTVIDPPRTWPRLGVGLSRTAAAGWARSGRDTRNLEWGLPERLAALAGPSRSIRRTSAVLRGTRPAVGAGLSAPPKEATVPCRKPEEAPIPLLRHQKARR